MAKDCEKVEQMMAELECTSKRVTKELIDSRISYDNAYEELWKLEAYRLMSN